MQTVKSPDELRTPLLSLVGFNVFAGILFLFWMGPLAMVLAFAGAAAIQFLIVNNLTANPGVAKVTALVLAILAGLDLLAALATMSAGVAPVTFVIIGADLTNLSMLGYAFIQLSGLQSPLASQPATTPRSSAPQTASAPPAAPPPDTMEQIKKLGELRTANVITEAEFQAKKAELLKRI